MNLRSTRQNDSIYDELKERLYNQREVKIALAYKNSTKDDLDMVLEEIEDWYDFNLFKLDEFALLANKSLEMQEKFISQKMYIENINIPEQAKLENILTIASILNNYGEKLIELNPSTLYILSVVSLNIGNKYGTGWNYQPIIDDILPLLVPYTEEESKLKEKKYTMNKIAL